jgi:hypothetical protein
MSVENWMQRMDRFVSQFEPEVLQQRPPGTSPAASEKIFSYVLIFLVVYSIVRGVAAAASRPFWFDELLTLTIASQPNLHDMWAAITRGFDGQTPPFYLLERACLALPVSKEIALRVPSIVSFPVLLICVFAFVKERGSQSIACLSALLILSTSLFRLYVIDARGYMLMNACFAFALVCYQRLPSGGRAVMLGASLFLAQSFHYYAVFVMLPLGLAELVFSIQARRFRWSVWAALAFGAVPLLVFWPCLTAVKVYYGSQVFSRPSLSQWTQYYGSYFLTRSAFGIALALTAIAAIVWSRLCPRKTSPQQADRRSFDLPEATLLFALTLLPFIVLVFARVMHGAILDRYTLPATIGVVLGIASGLFMVGPRGVVLFALFTLTSIGATEGFFWLSKGHEPQGDEFSIRSLGDFAQIEKFVQSGGHSDLPVVYAHPMAYCQVVHYSPAVWTRRLVCLSDQNKELQYENADSMFVATKGLSEFSPIHLADYAEFTSTHPEFLLYTDQRRWWTARAVLADAASMQLLRADGDMQLFLVKMKEKSAD